jgi:holin-like protein
VDTLRGFALLLLCQSAGEALSRLAHLPLPGPVIGLLLLWALLNVPAMRAPVGAAAEPLLAHLSLLFVPVGVGVVAHLGLVEQFGLRMLSAIVLSTWIGLLVAALVLRALLPVPGRAAGDRRRLRPEARCRTSSNCGSTCRRRRCSASPPR